MTDLPYCHFFYIQENRQFSAYQHVCICTPSMSHYRLLTSNICGNITNPMLQHYVVCRCQWNSIPSNIAYYVGLNAFQLTWMGWHLLPPPHMFKYSHIWGTCERLYMWLCYNYNMSESFWSVLRKISVLKSKGWDLYVLLRDHPNSFTMKLKLIH